MQTASLERTVRAWWRRLPSETLKQFVLGLYSEGFSYPVSTCFSARWEGKRHWSPLQPAPSHGTEPSPVNSRLPALSLAPEGGCRLEETTTSSDSPVQLFWKYFPVGCDMGRWTRQEQMSPDLETGCDLGG